MVYANTKKQNDKSVDIIYEDERFQNSNTGGLNINALFTELTDNLCSERGAAGLILKSETLSAPINRKLLCHLQNRQRIATRFDFINSNKIFNIGKDEQFSVLILGKVGTKSYAHQKKYPNLQSLDTNKANNHN